MKNRIFTLVVSGVLLTGACAANTATAMSWEMEPVKMEHMISAANTKADYEALSTQYANEAQALKDRAKEHNAMARLYEGFAAGSARGGYAAFAVHCRNLAKKYEEAAAEYTQLAVLHHQFAMNLPR